MALGAPSETPYTPEEEQKVDALITKYGKPSTVLHQQYEHGADATDGVLNVNGCCDGCKNAGEVEKGHFACSSLPEDIVTAENEGLVYRFYHGNRWLVVLDNRFEDKYEIDKNAHLGSSEEEY